MAEYIPTVAERQSIKMSADMLKVSGDGVFATLQGEGVTQGSPSVFLRLQFCNLTCGQPTGWQCDTGYTWDRRRPEFWQEPENWSYTQTAVNIQNAWIEKFGETEGKRLVVTGGEPLLQQRKIAKLLELLPDWAVEIETNGTVMPIPELMGCQFNCSPKLRNSGNTLQKRYKPDVLRVINDARMSAFKFVVTGVEDLLEIAELAELCHLDPEKILIMPEGQTQEAVQEHEAHIQEAVSQMGWKITQRKQFEWFGPKRRT